MIGQFLPTDLKDVKAGDTVMITVANINQIWKVRNVGEYYSGFLDLTDICIQLEGSDRPIERRYVRTLPVLSTT